MLIKQFGGSIAGKDKAEYSESKNWNGEKFVNQEATGMNFGIRDLPGMLYKQIFERKGRSPKKPIPVKSYCQDENKGRRGPVFRWYGHSVLLIQFDELNILIDPMFGSDAAPIAPFKSARFSDSTLDIIDDLPKIDLVLFTHDHYDHLDLSSINRLKNKVSRYFVALGVKRHLTSWGVQSDLITEFDWWEQERFKGIDITFTPSRHFSGRGLTDRTKSLWGGWVLRNEQHSVYFSGDGGYGKHFSEVGEKLGPFDIGFMECGQYNELWRQIHMFPDESILAARDAGVKVAVPVHWGAFALALHTWKEPADRFLEAAKANNQKHMVPYPGEPFSLEDIDYVKWWDSLI